MAVFSLMQMLTAPIWGRLSDRVGRRPVLMVSMAAAALAYLWLGFADALWMLFAARALAGACAGNIAAANAYIADVTTPENRAQGHGHDRRRVRPRLYHRPGVGRGGRRQQSRDRRSAHSRPHRLRRCR